VIFKVNVLPSTSLTTVISGVLNIIPSGGISNEMSGNVVPFGDVKVELLKTIKPMVIGFTEPVSFLNSIYSIAEEFLKALLPILVTLLPIVTFFKALQL